MILSSKPLSNVQVELLKLFSKDISDQELMDLKNILIDFYAKKSIALADQVWNEKKLSDEKMDGLLNSDEQ